jgi:para-nitrobenzyl esterase
MIRRGWAAVVVLAAIALMSGPAVAREPVADNAVVRTLDGLVHDMVTDDHFVFQGIPYARPPIGDLRWRVPRPARPWQGVRDATKPGPVCPQTYAYPPGSPPTSIGSEDCLSLNIHLPRNVKGRLPVMVFVHGGGFTGGAGAGYDPRRISRQGVVVVTVNYRLGAFGFLAHPALGDPWAGDFGIADQQLALRWVRRNIAAFGGDAHNVTLWGESAGAFSVCANIASPAARGLFDKAIMQSGPCANEFVTRAEAERRAGVAAAKVGCAKGTKGTMGTPRAVADCLRTVPARELSALDWDQAVLSRHIADLPWLPVAGTPAIPRQPLDAIRHSGGNIVPMIAGNTREEMRAVIVHRLQNGLGLVTKKEYPQLISETYGSDAPAVLAAYPLSNYQSPSIAYAAVLTDEGRAVGTCRQLAFDQAAAARTPVYAYEFAEPTGAVTDGFPHGALHGADVPYFFDSYFQNTPRPGQLAATMIEYWTSFARSGGPGHGWHRYQPGQALSIAADSIHPVDLATTHHCDFWAKL